MGKFVTNIFLFIALVSFKTNVVSAQKIRVDSIVFQGNERTKISILRRELDFGENDSLLTEELDKRLEFNRRKLMNTNLFIWVKYDYKVNKQGNLSIQFEFLEQLYTLVFPIFSIADRNLSDWLNKGADPKRIIYGINGIQNNLTGRNEKIGINLETGFTQRIDLSFSNPYIDSKKRFGLFTGFTYQTSKNLAYSSRNDTLLYLNSGQVLRERWSGLLGFRKRIKFYDFQSLELRYHNIRINDEVFNLNPHYLPNRTEKSEFIQLSYRFSYDYRDFATYPLRGRKVDVIVNYTGLTGNLKFNYYDFGIGYERYIPLGSNFYLSSTHKLKFTQYGKEVPYFLTQGLGYGSNVVRGYELNVIDGNNFYINRNTFKFQLINKIYNVPFLKYKQINQIPLSIYPTAFIDFGYVNIGQENYFNSKLGGKLLYGYGIGLDLVTYYNLVTKIIFPAGNGNLSGIRVSVGREF